MIRRFELFLWAILFAMSVVISFLALELHKAKLEVKTVEVEVPVVETKDILVSDRIKACEDKGGEYMLFWDKYEKEYIDFCETKQTKIDL